MIPGFSEYYFWMEMWFSNPGREGGPPGISGVWRWSGLSAARRSSSSSQPGCSPSPVHKKRTDYARRVIEIRSV
jgi:hypothetical protein